MPQFHRTAQHEFYAFFVCITAIHRELLVAEKEKGHMREFNAYNKEAVRFVIPTTIDNN